MAKYRKVNQAFSDLVTGLMRAQGFYSEMKETVESLHKERRHVCQQSSFGRWSAAFWNRGLAEAGVQYQRPGGLGNASD